MWGDLSAGPARGWREGRQERCLPHMPGPGLGAGGGGACCGGGKVFGGVEECGEKLGRASDSGGGAWTRKWDGVEEPAEPERLRC